MGVRDALRASARVTAASCSGWFARSLARAKSLGDHPLWIAGAAGLFDVARGQLPPYSSDQNTYVLHGLAQAGFGHLEHDWLVSTTDPMPVFTLLVRYGASWLVGLHALLAAVYAYSLSAIAARLASPSRVSPRGHLVALAIVFVSHSRLLERCSPLVTGARSTVPASSLLQDGLANHSALPANLVPSAFGAALVASIALYLAGRCLTAVVAAAVASTFEPAYLPTTLILVGAYVASAVVRREASRRRAALLVLVGLASTLPMAIYVLRAFPAATPALHAEALRILIHERLPHACLVSRWLTHGALVQLAAVGALLLVIRRGPGWIPLAAISSAALALSVTAIASGDPTLTLTLPWRASVLLVPIAWSTLFTRAALRSRWCARASIAAAGVCLLAGPRLRPAFESPVPEGAEAMTRWVRDHARATDTFVVPLSFEFFRLATGAPVVVDFKSHPYRDVEVVEWSERIREVRRFYAAGDCAALAGVAARFGATHVVLSPRDARAACGWRVTYEDASWQVAELGSAAGEPSATPSESP